MLESCPTIASLSNQNSLNKNLTVKGHLSDGDVAPALDLLNDDYKTVKFIGHSEEGSPYQGPPNAQVDAKWKRLTKGYSLKSPLPCFL